MPRRPPSGDMASICRERISDEWLITVCNHVRQRKWWADRCVRLADSMGVAVRLPPNGRTNVHCRIIHHFRLTRPPRADYD